MVSTNAGRNWRDANNGLPQRFVTSIVVSPSDATKAYITVSGFGSGHVFLTTNGGANWTNISTGLPNVPANALLIDPLNPRPCMLEQTSASIVPRTTEQRW